MASRDASLILEADKSPFCSADAVMYSPKQTHAGRFHNHSALGKPNTSIFSMKNSFTEQSLKPISLSNLIRHKIFSTPRVREVLQGICM